MYQMLLRKKSAPWLCAKYSMMPQFVPESGTSPRT